MQGGGGKGAGRCHSLGPWSLHWTEPEAPTARPPAAGFSLEWETPFTCLPEEPQTSGPSWLLPSGPTLSLAVNCGVRVFSGRRQPPQTLAWWPPPGPLRPRHVPTMPLPNASWRHTGPTRRRFHRGAPGPQSHGLAVIRPGSCLLRERQTPSSWASCHSSGPGLHPPRPSVNVALHDGCPGDAWCTPRLTYRQIASVSSAPASVRPVCWDFTDVISLGNDRDVFVPRAV